MFVCGKTKVIFILNEVCILTPTDEIKKNHFVWLFYCISHFSNDKTANEQNRTQITTLMGGEGGGERLWGISLQLIRFCA